MNGVLVFLGNIVGSMLAGFGTRVLYDIHKKRQEEKASMGYDKPSDPVVKRYLELTKL